MATLIRPEVSIKNKYWIDKHRHYELKHFCLQYPAWQREYSDLNNVGSSLSRLGEIASRNIPGDPTFINVVRRDRCKERIQMIEDAAKAADPDLYLYILKGVTEGLSYTHLKTRFKIPCGKDLYYDRYRRFFWLLNESRG